ncbi:MAG: DUF1904 domain-containing protein [Bdellovibrio sp.]
MPHVRFRAISADVMPELSRTLPTKLSVAINTPVDNFTMELIPTTFYANGFVDNSYPFVEVLWFQRSQEIQDECAKIITEEIKKLTSCEDVVVIFKALEKNAYYENGNHF